MTSRATAREILRIADGQTQAARDQLAVEEPLEIRIGDEPLAITMRTPGHDEELAAGFCLTEGIVQDPDELESVEPCALAEYGNIVTVRLTEEALARRAEQVACARRETYLSSSCGLCGKQSIDRIEQQIRPIVGRFTVSPAVIAALPQAMRQAQATFEQTGGLHAAALFTPGGELRVLREDVGRHNAVDKVIGWALLNNLLPVGNCGRPPEVPPRGGCGGVVRHHGETGRGFADSAPATLGAGALPAVLLVSGRASFEIMQKAAMAGIAMVCAVSAPSSLAADFAQRTGMTLVGFLRQGRMNVYAHPHRIAQDTHK